MNFSFSYIINKNGGTRTELKESGEKYENEHTNCERNVGKNKKIATENAGKKNETSATNKEIL